VYRALSAALSSLGAAAEKKVGRRLNTAHSITRGNVIARCAQSMANLPVSRKHLQSAAAIQPSLIQTSFPDDFLLEKRFYQQNCYFLDSNQTKS
jgi:hypothetical protein